MRLPNQKIKNDDWPRAQCQSYIIIRLDIFGSVARQQLEPFLPQFLLSGIFEQRSKLLEAVDGSSATGSRRVIIVSIKVQSSVMESDKLTWISRKSSASTGGPWSIGVPCPLNWRPSISVEIGMRSTSPVNSQWGWVLSISAVPSKIYAQHNRMSDLRFKLK